MPEPAELKLGPVRTLDTGALNLVEAVHAQKRDLVLEQLVYRVLNAALQFACTEDAQRLDRTETEQSTSNAPRLCATSPAIENLVARRLE